MAEYIDRKEAISAIARLSKNGGEEYLDALCAAEEVIKEMPSEDVAEVKHAKWLDGNKLQTCSNCLYRGKRSWNYCPNCGARMDEKE